jgi:hypothetical protein
MNEPKFSVGHMVQYTMQEGGYAYIEEVYHEERCSQQLYLIRTFPDQRYKVAKENELIEASFMPH